MVAGFTIVNFTSSRKDFLQLLHISSTPVFVAFFTLAGASHPPLARARTSACNPTHTGLQPHAHGPAIPRTRACNPTHTRLQPHAPRPPGACLKMGSLAANLPLASFVFTLRFGGILLGSYVGGRTGGCPAEQYERFWMGFITQACLVAESTLALRLTQTLARTPARSLTLALSLSPRPKPSSRRRA